MVVDHQGYIHVWYGAHGRYRTSKQIYARSKRPRDIREWIHPPFDNKITYPMPSVMSDGSIYVLYRAGNHSMPGSAPWCLRRSRDNGQTWDDPVTVIQGMSRDSTSDIYCEPTKYPGEDKIGLGISDEYLPGSATGHSTSHLFYVVFDAQTGAFQNVAGRNLPADGGLSIETLREHCLIADYDALKNYNRRIWAKPLISADGNIHVFARNGNPAGFDERPEDFDPNRPLPDYPDGVRPGWPPNYAELTYGGRDRIWRWDGGQWRFADPEFRLGMPSIRDGALRAWRVVSATTRECLESRDHGATWQRVALVALPVDDGDRIAIQGNSAGRPTHPQAQAIFVEYKDKGVGRAWLWGEDGIIGPPKPLSEPTTP